MINHKERMEDIAAELGISLHDVAIEAMTRKPVALMTIKEIDEEIGTLSNPSKMPGHATSTPAEFCITGKKLQAVKGSVCEGCYAMKGMYGFPTVKAALRKRLVALWDLERWTELMSHRMERKYAKRSDAERYFRFHDSGDVQSLEHLEAICEVARRNDRVQFWLPTRETAIVRKFQELNYVPSNLVIRISTHMVGEGPTDLNLPTSTVDWADAPWRCPARNQGNECGTCRACWEPEVANVDYPKH